MKRFLKYSYTIAMLIIFSALTACSLTDIGQTPAVANQVEVSEGQQSSKSVIEDDINIPNIQQPTVKTVAPETTQNSTFNPPSFEDYEEYIAYASSLIEFKPYYKTVFAFEALPNGVPSVPIDKVKDMYNDLKTEFEYIVVSEYPLEYIGNYEGDTNFVDGYEQNPSNSINIDWQDWNGNEVKVTPLKTVLLDENTFSRFDNHIDSGRNLQISDFTLKSPDDPIKIVLGNAYKDTYEIGDTFSMLLISEVMDFKVVGFYKERTGFSMDVAASHQINFDYTIVMPHFIPEYEPISQGAIWQHAFHIGELLSGNIAISEPIDMIGENTYDQYTAKVEEIAKKNDLLGMYKIPFWPVGFVWQD